MEKVQQIRMKMGLGESDYDFYRCHSCKRLLTRLEEITAYSKESKFPGKICTCGATKYTPTNLKWFEWVYPRVLLFAYYRIRGKA